MESLSPSNRPELKILKFCRRHGRAATAKRRRGFSETQKPKAQRLRRVCWTLFTSQFRSRLKPEASRAEKLRHVYDALAAPLGGKKSVAVDAFYGLPVSDLRLRKCKGISQTLLRQMLRGEQNCLFSCSMLMETQLWLKHILLWGSPCQKLFQHL